MTEQPQPDRVVAILGRGHVQIDRASYDHIGGDLLAQLNVTDGFPPHRPDVTVVEPDGSLTEIDGQAVSDALRGRAIEAHIHWLEVCLQDARTLAQGVVDGTVDRDDASDFLESTRKFQVGEGKAMMERMA